MPVISTGSRRAFSRYAELLYSYKGGTIIRSPQALAEVYNDILLIASTVRDMFLKRGGTPRRKRALPYCISALD